MRPTTKCIVCGSSKTFPGSLEVVRNHTPEVGVPEPRKRKNAPPCNLSNPRAKMQLNHLELDFLPHGGANSPIITVVDERRYCLELWKLLDETHLN